MNYVHYVRIKALRHSQTTTSEFWFITFIAELITKLPTPLNLPLFIFKRCPIAASHNAKILEEHNYQLDNIIRKQHPSYSSYGSEFRLSHDLAILLEDHPLWHQLKDILDSGSSFTLHPMNKIDHKADLEFHSSHVNHKSTKKFHHVISNIISKDIEKGLPFLYPYLF